MAQWGLIVARRDGVRVNLHRAVVLAAAAILVLLTAVYYYSDQSFLQTGFVYFSLAVLAASLVALLYFHIVRRKILSSIHRGILNAQEGILEPVSIPRAAYGFMERFVFDYNLLVTSLGSVFKEMEECQNRVIAERNRNNAILHSLPGALMCVDGDQMINLSNKHAEELFSLSCDELMGTNLFDLLQLDDAGREVLRDAFLYKQQVSNQEMLLHFNGKPHYFALNLSFFQSKNDNEVGAAIILHDITEYKRLQETMYDTEKLVAMGQLAAGVAHELNTPLGNIIGYAKLMRRPKTDRRVAQDYTEVIYDEARRCSRIVDDLLNYARQDRCQPETCKINAVIKDVAETIINCKERRFTIDIQEDLITENPEVQGAAGQLNIVFVNLLMNAIQATADEVKDPSVNIVGSISADGFAVVVIEDNGPGVPAGLRRRIFDPFFTTKEVGEGTGLGLAISHAIVTKLGGGLKYDATYNEGARFILRLPIAQQEVKAYGG